MTEILLYFVLMVNAPTSEIHNKYADKIEKIAPTCRFVRAVGGTEREDTIKLDYISFESCGYGGISVK